MAVLAHTDWLLLCICTNQRSVSGGGGGGWGGGGGEGQQPADDKIKIKSRKYMMTRCWGGGADKKVTLCDLIVKFFQSVKSVNR